MQTREDEDEGARKLTSTAHFTPANRTLGLAGTQAFEVAHCVALAAYRLRVEEDVQTHLQQRGDDAREEKENKTVGG